MSESSLICPLDSQALLESGLLTPTGTPGSHRLHKRRLNRSSEQEYNAIPLNLPHNSPIYDDAFATIPTVKVSQETLVHIGFSEQKATEIWEKWSGWPSSGPRRETDLDDGYGLQVSFLDFALGQLDPQANATDDDDKNWQLCLDTYGINIKVQQAIMDPLFKHLRLSESCLYWVRDTVKMRYDGLEEIQRSSRMRAMELQRAATGPGGDQEGNGRGGEPAGITHGVDGASTGQSQHSSICGQQQQTTLTMDLDLSASARTFAASTAPGYTVLFQAKNKVDFEGLIDETGKFKKIQKLLSSPPSDFSGTRALFYFTPNIQVAEYYAAYAKRRADCHAVSIICLRIPNTAIESLPEPDIQRFYWPDPKWKELVWHGRTQKTLPQHLRKYRQATLTIGTISRKPSQAYYSMKSWEEIQEEHVLQVEQPGKNHKAKGIQYVFNGEEEGREFLQEHAAGAITLFTKSEFDAWVAERGREMI